MPNNLKGGNTKEDVPTEEIQAAIEAGEHQRVHVFLKRKSAQGHMTSLAGRTEHTLEELFHAEEWIEPLCGGGKYRVEVMDSDKRGITVITPFWVYIEGPSKSPQQVRAALGLSGGAGAPASMAGGFGGPPMYPPPYGYPYSYSEPSEVPDPRQFWQQPPDAVAQENTRAIRKELEKKEDEHRKERDELLKRIDKLMERMAETEKRNTEALAKEREARLEAKIEAMARAGSSTKDSTTAELVKAAGLFAPVLVAMISTNKDSKALDVQQHQRAQELQWQTLTTFMKSNAGGFTELLKVALPAVAPMMVKMFEERSPSKMAELIGTMGESNLTMFSMLGDIMSRVMPNEPDNPWMQVINQGLQSLRDVAEQMAKVSKPGPARLASVPQMPQVPATTNGALQDHARGIADAICNEPSLESSLRTKEWHAIYYAVHRMDPPKDVADMLASRLTALHDQHNLPSFFRGVFEDESRTPSSFLKPLLEGLPIAQRPDYVMELLKAFDATFESTEAEVVTHDGP
jgi:hypothetical protein